LSIHIEDVLRLRGTTSRGKCGGRCEPDNTNIPELAGLNPVSRFESSTSPSITASSFVLFYQYNTIIKFHTSVNMSLRTSLRVVSRTRAVPSARAVVPRRFASSQSSHKPSSDLPWMIGSVGVFGGLVSPPRLSIVHKLIRREHSS
jgi:hypothetical protein